MVPEVADKAVRELFVKSYRLIYEVRADTVIVLAFVHGARQLQKLD
jgi:toxin ParE1/3/4